MNRSVRQIAKANRPPWWQRFAISYPMFPEGISTLLLMVALVCCAAWSLQDAGWNELTIPVAMVGLAAGIFGSFLAKLRVLDTVAHLVGISLGLLVSLATVALDSPELDGSLPSRFRPLIEIIGRWYIGTGREEDRERYLVSLLLSIIVWLVGYLACWILFRRGWIAVAIALPGFLLLITLAYAPDADRRFLGLFTIIAIPLLARFTLFNREREWRRLRVQPMRSLAPTVVTIGAVIGVLCTTIGWQSGGNISQASFQPLVGEVRTQIASTQDNASRWLQNIGGQPNGVPPAGSYTSFDESFEVSGPINLTDQQEVLVYADEAPYLSAQSFDEYTGSGWNSTVAENFPDMSFKSGQNVELSSEVNQDRVPTNVGIKNLGPETDRLLTVDTYSSSNLPTAVRMSWVQFTDTTISLTPEIIEALPPELKGFANFLTGLRLDGEDGEYGPSPSNPDDAEEVVSRRTKLANERFLTVTWQADSTGKAIALTVTGQAAIFDDTVGVYRARPERIESGGSYQVQSTSSIATGDDLAVAGSEYPEWVDQQYLQLPNTISPRTIALAKELTADAQNPYQAAKIIEQYLWENILYDTEVGAPPEGSDLVDYVLFESKRGYCTHYASAMAIMLRTLGIPARIVTGYYPGTYDLQQGGFLYLQKNAHAWVEVFFPGYGWIRFEPTSSQQISNQGEDGASNQVTENPEATVEPIPDLGPQSTPDLGSPIAEQEIPPPAGPILEASDGGGGNRRTWLGIGIASLALAAGLAFAFSRWIVPLRGLPLSGAMYLRLRRIARMLGVPMSASTTPAEVASSINRVIPSGHEHVNSIVQLYELDQFGPDRASPEFIQRASRGWASLRRNIPRLAWRRIGGRSKGVKGE